MNDPHDPMMPPPPKEFDEGDIWDEPPVAPPTGAWIAMIVFAVAVVWFVAIAFALVRYL